MEYRGSKINETQNPIGRLMGMLRGNSNSSTIKEGICAYLPFMLKEGMLTKEHLIQLEHLGVDISNPKDTDGNNLLTISMQANQKDIFVFLADKGLANRRDNLGDTPLIHSATLEDVFFANYLLDNGKSIIDERGYKDRNAIMKASEYGHLNIVEDFYNRDNRLALSRDDDGRVPIMCAARNGHDTVVTFFLDIGVDPNIQSYSNWTALMKASYHGHTSTVELLISRGANLSLRNSDNESASDLAKSNGHYTVAELLESRSKI